MKFFVAFARSIKRQKFVFALNLFGLSLGICCAYLIWMWTADELTFDRFHHDYQSIFLVQIVDKNLTKSIAGPPPLASVLKNEYPEIVGSTRYTFHSGGELLEYDQQKTYANGVGVDSSFFTIFSFPVVHGERKAFFNDPNSILITRKLSAKIFGKADPIGKRIKFRNEYWLEVKGILADIPQNSTIAFEYAVPYATFYQPSGDEWAMWNPATIIKLSDKANPQAVGEKIRKFSKIHERKERELALFPFSEVHFNLEDKAFFQKYTKFVHVQAIIIIGIFILVVSCINYINLSIAIFSKRSKEVGIKKTLGADKRLLTWQFLKESLFQGLLAVVIGLALLLVLRDEINGFVRKDIISLLNFTNFSIFIGISLLVAVLSGIYPAIFLSSFPPLSLIKGKVAFKNDSWGFKLREILILSQYSVTIIVLICTVILRNQINYIRNKDLGYNKEKLIAIPLDRGNISEKYELIRNELKAIPNVENVSVSSFRYIYFDAKVSEWEGKADESILKIYVLAAGYNFSNTMQLKLVAGRDFSEKFNEESNILINEEAARQMNLTDPVGKTLTWRNNKQTIIGVVKDFNYWEVNKKVDPIFIYFDQWGDMYVRIKPNHMAQTLRGIAAVFNQYNPAFPFEYHFINEEVDALYQKERTMEKMLTFFAFLCMFLSGLGLYALSTFVLQEKMKEVSIKKILGATAFKLGSELSMLFVKWVLLAFVLAVPIAVWGMHTWLSYYAYHTRIQLIDILVTLVLSLFVSSLAIIGNVVKATVKNPLEAIKAE